VTSPMAIEAAVHRYCEVLNTDYPEIAIVCPYCGKDRNHCWINVEKNTFRCYKCNISGNIYTLLRYYSIENIDDHLKELEDDTPLRELIEIHKDAKPDWTKGTVDLFEEGYLPRKGRGYLESRNVSLSLAKELNFRIGIEGKVRGTIVIPIIDKGSVANYVARRFMFSGERYIGPHKDEGFTPKGTLVYGIDRVQNEPVVLVEGVFDALALWEYGAVALMGKTASTAQISRVLTVASSVVILLDREGTAEEVKKLVKAFCGLIPLYIAEMKSGKDASSDTDEAILAIKNAKIVEEGYL
jgi:hypothetical protein